MSRVFIVAVVLTLPGLGSAVEYWPPVEDGSLYSYWSESGGVVDVLHSSERGTQSRSYSRETPYFRSTEYFEVSATEVGMSALSVFYQGMIDPTYVDFDPPLPVAWSGMQ